jgi:dihydroflavonol-4-reductase
MRVAVTGGSGVVGGAVVRHLVAAGDEVAALSRSPASDAVLTGLGAVPIRGDLFDDVALGSAFAGREAVYHVAGLNLMCPTHPAELTRVNVDGAVRVVRAARAAGVRRVVHTSSAAAIGEAAGTVGREDSPHRGHYLSHYERSKHLAEAAVLAEADGIEVVAVNPSSVQGPGRATGTGKLILDLLNGRLPALVDTRLSVVDIDDCARGHLLAAERGRPGERYLLNSFSLPIREAIDLLGRVTGRELRVRYLPVPAAMAAAAVVEGGFRLARKRPPVCREMVRTIAHGHTYDGSRATRELGLTYTPAETTLRALVEWATREGLLRPPA